MVRKETSAQKQLRSECLALRPQDQVPPWGMGDGPKSKAERNCSIFRRFIEGDNLKSLGISYGISRERVRQIIHSHERRLRWRARKAEAQNFAINGSIPIDGVEINIRIYHALRSAGLLTLQEAAQLSDAELLKIRNFGRRSLVGLKDEFVRHGLHH